MMMRMGSLSWVAAAAPAAAAACGPLRLPAVPVEGSGGDLEALAGEWSGEYWSPDTGRSGSIVFRLSSATGAAEGDVVMVPRGAAGPVQAYDGADGVRKALDPQPLGIRFVHVAGGALHGDLEPYRDPECGCPLGTTFHGEVRGDRIEGTFVTRGPPGHADSTGRWSVRRIRG
jgi:hypothetical protein